MAAAADGTHQKKRKRGSGRKQAPPGYYTAKEAYTRLGMKPATFFRNVGEQGLQIRKYVPLGSSREGYYIQEEIDLLAVLRKSGFVEGRKLGPTVFRTATVADIPGMIEVLHSLGGWEASQPSAEQRAQYYERNPEIDHVVVRGDMVVGFISGIPYTQEVMHKRLYGLIEPKDIAPQDILPFEPGHTYDLFVGVVEWHKPLKNPEIFARYGARLALGFRRFIVDDLVQRNIRIRMLLGHSAEPEGQRLADAMGFVQQGTGTYPIYVLDMEHSETEWVQRYREHWPIS